MNIKSTITAIAMLVASLVLSVSSASAATLRYDSVAARGTDSWTFTLCAGVTHEIIVRGDGDTDLDFYLYDGNGNLIDSDEDGTDYCVLRVSPRWSGKFTLVVRNHGRVCNNYRLLID